MNLFTEKITETVHHIDRAGRRLGKLIQRLNQVKFIFPRDRHDIDTGLITQIMDPVAQRDRLIDILDIGRNTNHIDRAFIDRLELLLQHTVRINHNADLDIRFDSVDDLADLVIITILPSTILFRIGHLTAGPIAQLHIINSGVADSLIDGPDKFIREIVVIDQPAIADRTIQNFNLFSVHNTVPLFVTVLV